MGASLPFIACCGSSLQSSFTPNMYITLNSLLLSSEPPHGYSYTASDNGLFLMVPLIPVAISNAVFNPWISDRTHPYQKMCIVGVFAVTAQVVNLLFITSVANFGAWTHG